MYNKILSILFFACLSQFACDAQIDSFITRRQREFEQFKQSREQEFQKFKNRNDSLFYEYLNKSWEEYEFFYNEKKTEPKPIKQPEISLDELLNHKGKEIFPTVKTQKDVISDLEEKSVNVFNIYDRIFDKKARKPVNILYYSNEDTLFLRSEKIVVNENLTTDNIKKFYRYAESSEGMDEIISQLNTFRNTYHLNDWAFIQITQIAAKQSFETSNTQILFVWYILMKSGFKAKTGYSGNDIFLLITSFQEIFNTNTVTIDGEQFYDINSIGNKKFGKIFIHDGVFPGTKRISMKIDDLPIFKNQKIIHEINFNGDNFTIDLNSALIDFFNDYPHCDLDIYFNTPLSSNAINSLDPILKPLLDGKSEKEKVTILLKFIHESFAYQLDEIQFRREKYMFPDEVLKYPYSDCEDRAVLFAKLVILYTKLTPLGLNYPGHVSVAINLKTDSNVDYIQHYDEKYVVCDPTYIKAGIGLLPEFYTGIQPQLIEIFK